MKKLVSFLSLVLLAGATVGCNKTTAKEWSWKDAISDGELGYAILVGEDGNPEAEDRTKGCVDALNSIAAEGGRYWSFKGHSDCRL